MQPPGYPSPYAPPQAPLGPPGFEGAPFDGPRPGVILWARIYATLFAVMYLVATFGGVFLLYAGSDLSGDKAGEAMVEGVIMVVLCPALMVLSVVAAVAPRKKWGWILNVVLIGLGCTSCMCMPASIPLVIFWLKPEVKRWYGMA